MHSLENIAIVLSHSSHPGNIGAAARAMKNMGLSKLILVNPQRYPSGEATARAAGADDILQQAEIYDNLTDAIADYELVLGTSGRSRHLPWPMQDPSQAGEYCIAHSEQKIAILFGNERSGLSNEELATCHYHVCIPSVEGFSSLNLGAAVQVIAYELRKAVLAQGDKPAEPVRDLASHAEMAGLHEHWSQTMVDLEFLDRTHPKLLIKRIQRLFNRAQLEKNEVNILRGFLSAIGKRLK